MILGLMAKMEKMHHLDLFARRILSRNEAVERAIETFLAKMDEPMNGKARNWRDKGYVQEFDRALERLATKIVGLIRTNA